MPELSPTGYVEIRPDGSKVFTHGQRLPDNHQQVVQEYNPRGHLHTVRVK